MASAREIKNERKAIYFDIICGIISSVLALTGLTFAAISKRIFSMGWFTVSVTFWTGYLLFSFFLIGLGIYTWKKEKNFDSMEPRKDLKAPIV
ncbi:MAG: hypothetical protein E3J52_12720 [Promethearchaeota archaeon]|nr:MAG: hypothetical protein E3J52_12720 [Candidatus Lokiarchaeota archaeon]